jgi:O-antigen/teichoic acid export membrane protein
VFTRFLNISNYWYFFLLYISFVMALILPVNYGVLRGLQRFISLGSSNTLIAVLKLAFGVLLVYLGLGVYGSLVSLNIASVLTFLFTLYFLRDIIRAGKEKIDTGGFYPYIGSTMLAIAAFTLLTNMDVILVKHYLSAEISGEYSVLVVLGKVALALTGGVVVAMFPKISQLFDKNSSRYPVLLRAGLLTIVLGGGLTIIYWVFGVRIISFLYNGQYDHVAPYLLKYTVAMCLYALTFMLMNYFMSMNRMKITYSLILTLLLQLVLIAMFHADINQVVNIVLITAALSFFPILPFFFIGNKTKTDIR